MQKVGLKAISPVSKERKLGIQAESYKNCADQCTEDGKNARAKILGEIGIILSRYEYLRSLE